MRWWLAGGAGWLLPVLAAALALLCARWTWRGSRRDLARPLRPLLWSATALGVLVASLLLGLAGFHLWYHHRPQPDELRRRLFPGIDYIREVRRGERPLVAHVVRVDLRQQGLSFLVTPPRPVGDLPLRAQVTSEFLREHRLQLAVNGDFFWPFHSRGLFDTYPKPGDPVAVLGIAISRGDAYHHPRRGYDPPTLFLTEDGRAMIAPASRRPEGAENAVSGSTLVLVRGEVPARLRTSADDPEPRTAVALDAGGRTLLLFVVDGRQPGYSVGLTLGELAELTRHHGAHTALNLDGGGSTTLVIEEAGRARVLSSPIHTRLPFRERPVGNHLGLWVRPPP